MTPHEPKKAKSIALSNRSHLEAIRVDWQCEVDRLSIADFKPIRALITKLAQNRKAAVVNCSSELQFRRPWQYKIIDSSLRVNKLAFHFFARQKSMPNYQLYTREWKRYG